MSKPTLEQLAPYLPYGLKFKRVDGENIFQAYGVDCQQGMWLNTCGHGIIEINGTQLLLRPMSELTKKLTIEGEEKIPLVEIFKMTYIYEVSQENFKNLFCNTSGIFLEAERYDGKKQEFNFRYSPNGSFVFTMFNPEVEHILIDNQLSLIQKLFEWKFDVFGLIESGAAIDCNTLTENIY